MSARKSRPPLSEDERALAEKAWGLIQPLLRKMRNRYPGADVDGLVAEWLTRRIGEYDPSRSSFSTWAINEAWFALRREFTRWYGSKDGKRPAIGWHRMRFWSLDAMTAETPLDHMSCIAVYDPPSPMEIEAEMEEMRAEARAKARARMEAKARARREARIARMA